VRAGDRRASFRGVGDSRRRVALLRVDELPPRAIDDANRELKGDLDGTNVLGPRATSRENANTLAALPRFWVCSLGRQRTTDERTISRPNTQPGLPSNNHLWKLPRSRPSPRRSAARCVLYAFLSEIGW